VAISLTMYAKMEDFIPIAIAVIQMDRIADRMTQTPATHAKSEAQRTERLVLRAGNGLVLRG
jgi:hypothetical protein